FAGLGQIFAIERALDRHFTLRTAADRADVPAHAGTEAPGPADFANRACHALSIEGGISSPMKRTNLFFKLEIEHDAEERPERLGEEIRRQLMKFYGVRDAELTNYTPVER